VRTPKINCFILLLFYFYFSFILVLLQLCGPLNALPAECTCTLVSLMLLCGLTNSQTNGSDGYEFYETVKVLIQSSRRLSSGR